jgi:hypothetical protein
VVVMAKRHAITLGVAFGVTVVIALSGYSVNAADEYKFPTGYRYWFHVNTAIVTKDSPLFDAIGGMHNAHVNTVGEAALKSASPYPDGTVFIVDLHDYALADGTYTEGAIKGVAFMQKDAVRYAATGGWGFEFWAGGDPQKPIVKDPVKECFACHQSQKSQDYVFSTYIP